MKIFRVSQHSPFIWVIESVIKLSSNFIPSIFQGTWRNLDVRESKELREMLRKSVSSSMLGLENVNV